MRLRLNILSAAAVVWIGSSAAGLADTQSYGEIACLGALDQGSLSISKKGEGYVWVEWEHSGQSVIAVEKGEVLIEGSTLKALIEGVYFEWDHEKPQPNAVWVWDGELTRDFCVGFLADDYEGEILFRSSHH